MEDPKGSGMRRTMTHSRRDRTLLSAVVENVIAREDLRGNRLKGIAILQKGFDDGRQRCGCVLRCVVEEHDRPGLHATGHSFCDVGGG